MKKHIAILGSTGSIGTQALEVIRNFPDLFGVEVLTAQSNSGELIRQAMEFAASALKLKPDAVPDISKVRDWSYARAATK